MAERGHIKEEADRRSQVGDRRHPALGGRPCPGGLVYATQRLDAGASAARPLRPSRRSSPLRPRPPPARPPRPLHPLTSPPRHRAVLRLSRPTTSTTSTTEKAPQSLTVAAGGDVQGDRNVGKYIDAHGGAAALAKVKPYLQTADLAFVNLEGPVSDKGTKLAWKEYTFRSRTALTSGLASAGIDVVSMANNHAVDCGQTALLDTIARLDKVGIAHAGAGEDISAARHGCDARYARRKGRGARLHGQARERLRGRDRPARGGHHRGRPRRSWRPSRRPRRRRTSSSSASTGAPSTRSQAASYQRALAHKADRRRSGSHPRPPSPRDPGAGGVPRQAHRLQPRRLRVRPPPRADRARRSSCG